LLYAIGLPLWQEDGVDVCTAANDQENPQLIPDGSGGAIVVWQDEREDGRREIYAQRVYSDGTPAWATDGVSLCAVSTWQHNPQLASDGSGGAIVTWEASAGGNLDDIYAQRVDGDGNLLWTLDGVSLCAVSHWQQYTQIAPDGSGGAVVTWQDLRNSTDTGNDIYAQRVNSNGTTAWVTNGVSLCLATGNQHDPQITSDGSGGAIVTWVDEGGSDWDVHAQRVYSDGTIAWATDGVSLCIATGHQVYPKIASDGAAGAIVTWEDRRNGSSGTGYDIYARRVNDAGTALWQDDGVTLCMASGHQYDPQIVSDGSGGAIVAWYDLRVGSNSYDIYAQKVDGDGNALWQTDGVSLCVAADNQLDPQITSDGSGGAIVAWADWRGLDYDIYAQWVDADGNVLWQADGVRLCDATYDQESPQITTAPNGGAIVAWVDYRTGARYDIYAQRVADVTPMYLPLAVKNHE
jgi:hypothetical protein